MGGTKVNIGCSLNVMPQIEFKLVSAEDRETILRYTLQHNSQACDLAFSNLYGWSKHYHTSWAIIKDLLCIRFYSPGGKHPIYWMPVGKNPCDLPSCLHELKALAEEGGYPLVIMGIGSQCREHIEAAYPNAFHFFQEDGQQDYIYLREKLASLSGKSLQSKRNHINKFEKLYPNYGYETISADNIDECLSLEDIWLQEHEENESRASEQEMIRRVAAHYEEFGLSGGLLRVDGKVIAFTIGSPINDNTFGVHIEKASRQYDGAFAMINREFARRIPEQYTYVNREEDLGLEGLRKAKLSYKPEYLLSKATAILRHASLTEEQA